MYKRKKIEVKIEGLTVCKDLIQEALKKNKLVDDLKEELKRNFKKVEFVVK